MKLSIVVPFYNEAKRLPNSLKQILNYLEKQEYDWEIILVDDGSKDNTKTYINSFLPNNKIKLITHEENSGKGAAVRTGILASNSDLVLFTDADLSIPITEVEKLLDAMNSGYKIAIGSKYMPESKAIKKRTLTRRLFGKSSSLIIRIILKMPYLDTQCGFKIFETELAKKYFSKLKTNKWGFDYEILYKAKKDGIIAKEIPVIWHDNTESKVNIVSDYTNCFIDLIKIRFRK